MLKKTFSRLPRGILPQNYRLALKTDFAKSICSGTAEISLEVSERSSVILLDAVDLKVEKCSLKLDDGTCWEAENIRSIPEDERLEVSFAESLPIGSCTMSLNFEGEIGTALRGFYKTKPKMDAGGQSEVYGVTQFAATEARRCFPCWDEPSFKATFELTFTTPSGLQVLSNMGGEEITDVGDGWKQVRYPKTPKMSSYLVAFSIGKYDYVESKTKTGVIVRVHTPEGMKSCGNFALEVAVRSLQFYEDYFSIPYPLPKLDLLAVNDFAYGAMENWGLVIFRQTYLLADEKQTDLLRKQRIACIVAHELAHQWFGNLVTMEWWTHLWLNEGFANFMESFSVDHLYPEYGLGAQISLDLNAALKLDALDSSHPIEVPINHPSETDEIFDAISYNKGAAIIGMLFHHIGAGNFREGMAKYLKKHEYANAQTKDLWLALQTEGDSSIPELMESWTSQMGFPQLTVRLTDGELFISQEKFYSDAANALKAVIKPKWKVPVSIATNVSETPIKIVLDDVSTKIQLPAGTTWVHVNSGGNGVFRVLYDESMFLNLLSALKQKELTNDRDRYCLHADLFAQAAANYAESVPLLQLTSVLEDDESYIVWQSITDALGELAHIYQSDRDLHDHITGFARKTYAKIFAKLGWERSPKDDHSRCLLRVLVIEALINFDDKDVIAEANKRFRESLAGTYCLPADLQVAAYKGFAKSEDTSTWETLWPLFKTAKLQTDETKLLHALAASKNEDIISKLLNANLSDEIRSQNGPLVVSLLANSAKSRSMLWSHYTKHHLKYNGRFNAGIMLPAFIKALTGSFTTLEEADEVLEFFKKNPIPGTERSLLQTRERVLGRAAWRQRGKESLVNFLKA